MSYVAQGVVAGHVRGFRWEGLELEEALQHPRGPLECLPGRFAFPRPRDVLPVTRETRTDTLLSDLVHPRDREGKTGSEVREGWCRRRVDWVEPTDPETRCSFRLKEGGTELRRDPPSPVDGTIFFPDLYRHLRCPFVPNPGPARVRDLPRPSDLFEVFLWSLSVRLWSSSQMSAPAPVPPEKKPRWLGLLARENGPLSFHLRLLPLKAPEVRSRSRPRPYDDPEPRHHGPLPSPRPPTGPCGSFLSFQLRAHPLGAPRAAGGSAPHGPQGASVRHYYRARASSTSTHSYTCSSRCARNAN